MDLILPILIAAVGFIAFFNWDKPAVLAVCGAIILVLIYAAWPTDVPALPWINGT